MSCFYVPIWYKVSCRLCPLHIAGSQAAGADMHSLRATVYLAFYFLDISFPHCIGFSIGMAYIVTKKDALAANITLCHFCHLLNNRVSLRLYFVSVLSIVHNIDILPEIYGKSK